MNSASQAALAALQMHSKPTSPAPAPLVSTHRSNSLSNYGRSNSMRTYTYTPKPSYQTGPTYNTASLSLPRQPHHPGPTYQQVPSLRSNSLRSNSLRSGSLRNAPLQRPQSYHHRQNSADRSLAEEDDDADSIVITTKTTKVVDSMGRTKSITTETIKTMPDGSNIIETKTTNISRPTSRSNSLRNNSLSHGINNNYNLDKIEEDLQDFDYTYLDHEDRNPPPRLNDGNINQSPRTQKYIQEQRKAIAPVLHSPGKPEERAGSLSSNQSPKRLKSILKNSSSISYQSSPVQDSHEEASIQDVISQNEHTYSPHKKDPAALGHDFPQQTSVASGASIKFRETVETISYPAESHNLAELLREEALKKDLEKKKNVDMYSQAMRVAMERVYGRNSEDNAGFHTPPQSPVVHEPGQDLDALAEKKLKKDHKRDKVESAGISKNYIYENHHRDFSVRSLRGGPHGEEAHGSTRKERAKEEKRLLKEEEKRNAELLKAAEKERIKEEKFRKKKDKKPFSLFGKKKRKDVTVYDSTMYEQTPDSLAVIEESAVENSYPEQSPKSSQPSNYSTPPQEAIHENHEDTVIPDGSSAADSSSNFVDVPDIVDDYEEEGHAEQPSIQPAPVSSHTDVIEDPNVPARGDIAELHQNNSDVPPRGDLQLLNSEDVQVQPIPEEKLPTLISGDSSRPQVILDETINDPGSLTGVKSQAGSLEYPVPNVDGTVPKEPVFPQSQSTSNGPKIYVGSYSSSEVLRAPNRITKPELQVLDENFSQPIDQSEVKHAFQPDLSSVSNLDHLTNEASELSKQPGIHSHSEVHDNNVVSGSAASEESERTLQSSGDHEPVKVTLDLSTPVHISNGERFKEVPAIGHQEQTPASVTATSDQLNPTTSGKENLESDTDKVQVQEVSGPVATVAPELGVNLGSPIQLTLSYKQQQQVLAASKQKFASEEKISIPRIAISEQKEVVPEEKIATPEQNILTPEQNTANHEKHGKHEKLADTKETKESKKSPKKRTQRFKKIIDKYFINNYSR
ncbi:CIC11C00000005320 [Sungouiella intermedia]|uniref:CIC11C00000005320 n=1 Tax=Sungouiella intermedia TaxID=45354 RepID=A0A1L0DL59_9ASCO|nr:CIC11C00000005320 [[Candida] intermedia]